MRNKTFKIGQKYFQSQHGNDFLVFEVIDRTADTVTVRDLDGHKTESTFDIEAGASGFEHFRPYNETYKNSQWNCCFIHADSEISEGSTFDQLVSDM